MLEVRDLRKSFRDLSSKKGVSAAAVAGVSFHVEAGQFFTLLGPSGCGKTTTLRCVAGLENPEVGEITLAGRPLYSSAGKVNVKANQRGLGMVFQSYAIWPHMTVFKNVSFPLTVGSRRERLSRAEVQRRTERVLAVVQLDHLAGRPATDLSGGQQQRLALARALVNEPPLLLLDEPLSNLDAKLREQMRFELKRLQRELGLTTVYVTHDQSEALAMSNVVAVMRDGEIDQLGSPREIYTRPATEFVADFIGTTNFFRGSLVESLRSGAHLLRTPDGDVEVVSDHEVSVGDDVTAITRPEAIKLTEVADGAPSPSGRSLRGRVRTSIYLGEAIEALVEVGSTEVRVRTSSARMLPAGTEVYLDLDPASTRIVRTSGAASGGEGSPHAAEEALAPARETAQAS